MKFKSWYEKRDPRFIYQRGMSLLKRYGVRAEKTTDLIKACVSELTAVGCAPTLPTTAIIVRRYPQFVLSLQEAGAEIAVHGYHHINLADLPVAEANHQLIRAVRTFEHFGIEVRGFRCPYLGYRDELLDSLPIGIFDYSSNEAISWGGLIKDEQETDELFFETLNRFYNAKDSSEKVCMPWFRSNMVEIPVCIPDDLQLHDGLQFDSEVIAQKWLKMLQQGYLRGELFTLLFHTELISFCINPFLTIIRQAQSYKPKIWLARLRDISNWWREKSKFGVEITPVTTGLHLHFTCTPRATILARGVGIIGSEPIWDGDYHRVLSDKLDVSIDPRPFVGIAANIPERIVSFLTDQGYILDAGETARSCGIYLDNDTFCKLTNEVELVNYIETSSAPLVRYWRWPDGAKSALCITGDLDALTLFDYASRIFIT